MSVTGKVDEAVVAYMRSPAAIHGAHSFSRPRDPEGARVGGGFSDDQVGMSRTIWVNGIARRCQICS
jgi:hypothetical protein